MTDTQKNAVVFGLANKRSIAWAIAQKLHAAGWRLGITYMNERLGLEAKDLIAELPGASGFMCDLTKDDQIARLFDELKSKYGVLHAVVHSVGFAPPDELKNPFLMTTREGFRIAHDISVYSLIAVARGAAPLMTQGGGIVTLTYYGSEKVVPNYNVMGVAKAALEASVRYLANDLGPKAIRVNAISAGPIRTLAAAGIGDFRYILKWNENNAPLRRGITVEEVGDAAVYLLSDLSRGVTGEIHHVDVGYLIVGMKHPDAPDMSVIND